MPDDDPLGGARRVLVYGVTGSGKTTLAERLGHLTGLPWYSVDDLTWEPGWVAVPHDEQRRRIAAICARPEWILDTAYARWRDIPLARAEVVVALDYPRRVSLQRLVRRTVARWWSGTTICNGNRESPRMMVSRESIVLWHFKSFGRKRRRIHGWMAQDGGPTVVRLTRPRDTEAWLCRVSGASPRCCGRLKLREGRLQPDG
ncbi:MAG: adenylate kinase [Acidimicrobiales bacterium]